MIQSENSPTLCPHCIHFKKERGYPGCHLITWRDTLHDAEVRHWMRRQFDERSWEYTSMCPRFEHNGSESLDGLAERAIRKWERSKP
jgi:hypothetical protein